MNKDENFLLDIMKMPRKDIEKKYKYLGEGISRKVYAINDDYVVKIGKGLEGVYQNSVEYYVFTHANENYFKYLCPILHFSKNRIIMPRAKPLSKYIRSKFLDLSSIRDETNAQIELESLSKNFFLLYNDIRATSSWGEINGVNYLIDYGCTSDFGDFFYDFIFSKPTWVRTLASITH